MSRNSFTEIWLYIMLLLHLVISWLGGFGTCVIDPRFGKMQATPQFGRSKPQTPSPPQPEKTPKCERNFWNLMSKPKENLLKMAWWRFLERTLFCVTLGSVIIHYCYSTAEYYQTVPSQTVLSIHPSILGKPGANPSWLMEREGVHAGQVTNL